MTGCGQDYCSSAAQFFVGEARAFAGRVVERRPQPGCCVALRQHAKVQHRLQPVALAQPAVPVVADGHMADFVAQDDVEDFYSPQRIGRG